MARYYRILSFWPVPENGFQIENMGMINQTENL